MTLPDHSESFSDGAVPFATQTAQEITVGFGVSSSGTAATLSGPYLRAADVITDFGYGPLTQWACFQLSENKGVPIYLSRVTGSTAGASSAVTASGSGPTVTLSGAPYDDYAAAQVKIITGGTRATATFKYTLDGVNWSQEIVTAATYVIPNSGITVNFATGTYVAAETYSWTSTAPYYSASDFGTAYDQADAAGVAWKSGHLLGQVGGATDADKATALGVLIAAAKAKIAASLAAHRIRVLILEGPAVTDATAGDAALAAVTDALDSTSMAVVADFCTLTSAIDGLSYTRSAAWPAVARMRAVGRKIDPAWVALGPLCGASGALTAIRHDEYKREGLNSKRFVTLRTYEGEPGFYLTNFWLFSPPGSDYRYIQMRRVINDAARLARARMLRFVSGGVRTYPGAPNTPSGKVAGAILEEDALSIEGVVNDLLAREITNKGDAEKVWIEIVRTNALKTDETLKYRCRARLPGYVKFIEGEFGFAI